MGGNPFSWIDERAALEARIDELERSLDAALEDNAVLRGEREVLAARLAVLLGDGTTVEALIHDATTSEEVA